MTTTAKEAKPSVVEALSAVMADVQAVGKADRNTQQGYVFRGIDAVVNAVGPAFRKHGIVAVPHQSEARYRDVLTNSGKPSRECTVSVTYRFYGPAGDFIECSVPGESMDFGDKGAPKAMSVAYRIALLQALCIPTDEPEPDAQSYERASAPGWDPETQVLIDAFLDEIRLANDDDDIAAVGKSVHASRTSGELPKAAYDRLAQAAATRKAELNGAAK
jgi:hypothetical protein